MRAARCVMELHGSCYPTDPCGDEIFLSVLQYTVSIVTCIRGLPVTWAKTSGGSAPNRTSSPVCPPSPLVEGTRLSFLRNKHSPLRVQQ